MEIINFIHIPKNGGTSIKDLCDKNKLLKYNGHHINPYNKNLQKQLIILRNPIERFISAVNHSLQKWSHEPHVKYLIEKKINTPEQWVQILMNSQDKEYSHLMDMVKNKHHKIGDKILEYKWPYSPQYLWVNNPQFIIIMDNFNEEIKYFLKKYNMTGIIPQKNKTSNNDKCNNNKLSEKSIKFLMQFYKQDFILYEKYKKIKVEKRI
jgi:hypothetical protein